MAPKRAAEGTRSLVSGEGTRLCSPTCCDGAETLCVSAVHHDKRVHEEKTEVESALTLGVLKMAGIAESDAGLLLGEAEFAKAQEGVAELIEAQERAELGDVEADNRGMRQKTSAPGAGSAQGVCRSASARVDVLMGVVRLGVSAACSALTRSCCCPARVGAESKSDAAQVATMQDDDENIHGEGRPERDWSCLVGGEWVCDWGMSGGEEVRTSCWFSVIACPLTMSLRSERCNRDQGLRIGGLRTHSVRGQNGGPGDMGEPEEEVMGRRRGDSAPERGRLCCGLHSGPGKSEGAAGVLPRVLAAWGRPRGILLGGRRSRNSQARLHVGQGKGESADERGSQNLACHAQLSGEEDLSARSGGDSVRGAGPPVVGSRRNHKQGSSETGRAGCVRVPGGESARSEQEAGLEEEGDRGDTEEEEGQTGQESVTGGGGGEGRKVGREEEAGRSNAYAVAEGCQRGSPTARQAPEEERKGWGEGVSSVWVRVCTVAPGRASRDTGKLAMRSDSALDRTCADSVQPTGQMPSYRANLRVWYVVLIVKRGWERETQSMGVLSGLKKGCPPGKGGVLVKYREVHLNVIEGGVVCDTDDLNKTKVGVEQTAVMQAQSGMWTGTLNSWTHIETYTQENRCTHLEADRSLREEHGKKFGLQNDGHANRHSWKKKQADRQTSREESGRTEEQTDRQDEAYHWEARRGPVMNKRGTESSDGIGNLTEHTEMHEHTAVKLEQLGVRKEQQMETRNSWTYTETYTQWIYMRTNEQVKIVERTDRRTEERTDRQVNRREGRTETQAYRCICRETGRQIFGQADGQVDMQNRQADMCNACADGLTNKQLDRQRDGHANKQTDGEMPMSPTCLDKLAHGERPAWMGREVKLNAGPDESENLGNKTVKQAYSETDCEKADWGSDSWMERRVDKQDAQASSLIEGQTNRQAGQTEILINGQVAGVRTDIIKKW
jgi:hypothetical protein